MSAMDSNHEKKQRRSTDAPETNALVRKAMTEPNVCIHRLAAKLTLKCEDLERERNAARCELWEMVVAVSLSSFLPGDAYEWLQSHPENADVEARRK